MERKQNAIYGNLDSANNLIVLESDICIKDSNSLKKHLIQSLSENLQNFSDKNVNLFRSFRKLNEKHLGITKLDQISFKLTSRIIEKTESKHFLPPKSSSNISLKREFLANRDNKSNKRKERNSMNNSLKSINPIERSMNFFKKIIK